MTEKELIELCKYFTAAEYSILLEFIRAAKNKNEKRKNELYIKVMYG